MRFTSLNAAEMGKRSVEKRKERAALALAVVELPLTSENDFNGERLARLRALLVQFEAQMAHVKNSKTLERVSAAWMRASEVERQLSGRSLPAAIRATSAPIKRLAAREINPID